VAAAVAGALHVVTRLDLIWNDIGRDGCAALAGSLRSMPGLLSLDLSGNESLGDDGCASLAGGLGCVCGLPEPSLSRCGSVMCVAVACAGPGTHQAHPFLSASHPPCQEAAQLGRAASFFLRRPMVR